MATTGSVFSQTLQEITNAKLNELAKKRDVFENQRIALLDAANKEHDVVQRLVELSNGVKECFAVTIDRGRIDRSSTNNPLLTIDLKNLDRFLKQARYDPSISLKIQEQWQGSLIRHLNIQSLKFSFASLYGNLTTEWLRSKQATPAPPSTDDVDMDDFEKVEGGKKHEARLVWEEMVFNPAGVDHSAVKKLLSQIFSSPTKHGKKGLQKAMELLRTHVTNFERSLASPSNFNKDTLTWTINSLQASDLLTDEKREVLKDFMNNDVILNEVADVLNMRMSAIGSWSWGDEVQLEQRRQLSGSYHIYMHEDLLQAIFLQYIGIKWSVFWKSTLANFRDSLDIWKPYGKSVPQVDRFRREYYLRESLYSNESVRSRKWELYSGSYFLSQLKNTETEIAGTEQGDEEADFEVQVQPTPGRRTVQSPQNAARSRARTMQMTQTQRAQMAQQQQQASAMGRGGQSRTVAEATYADEEFSDRTDEEHSHTPTDPMDKKQTLLHLLTTDILIKTRFQGELTSFRTQLSNLYPSLDHGSVLLVLEFLGVSRTWLQFFRRFLQAPLRFMEDKAAPRLRQRGTPGSHTLSEVFGEVVLFCLDYGVNQVAEGDHLWRLHDDLWFWSHDSKRCVAAWQAIEVFADTFGLSLNEPRSGSARMVQNMEGEKRSIVSAELPDELPRGQIRWGMLYLNPNGGRFEIDQKMVDHHIEELTRQLKTKSDSVFAWVQAWNTYATTFFTSNFGKAANCFGQKHVDNVLETHERIQRSIFSAMGDDNGENNRSVVGYLKKAIEQRFGIKNIPDGYFFAPIELGGLEVQSAFIGQLQIRDKVAVDPGTLLDDFEEKEREYYSQKKREYEANPGPHGNQRNARPSDSRPSDWRPEDPSTFMPFDEYIRYREELAHPWQVELVTVFNDFTKRPSEESVETDDYAPVRVAIYALKNQKNLKNIMFKWRRMNPYWKWVAQLYGPEIIEHFGGFNIVDPGLLPIGMVGLFRSGRVKWQG